MIYRYFLEVFLNIYGNDYMECVWYILGIIEIGYSCY